MHPNPDFQQRYAFTGQSYVDGRWGVEPEQLFNFLYLIRSQDSSKLQKWFVLSNRFHAIRDVFKQRFFPIRSTRAVVEHYNTDPVFMSYILGPSLSYTCAFFDGMDMSLEEAQDNKVRIVAERIALSSQDEFSTWVAAGATPPFRSRSATAAPSPA